MGPLCVRAELLRSCEALPGETVGCEREDERAFCRGKRVDLIGVLEAEIAHLGRGVITASEHKHPGVMRVDRVRLERPGRDLMVLGEEKVAGESAGADPLFVAHALRPLVAEFLSERADVPACFSKPRYEHALPDGTVKEKARLIHGSGGLQDQRSELAAL